MKITEVVITPIAMKDPPLRNIQGLHQPYALRSILQVRTDEGLTGLGETYGDLAVLTKLRQVAPRLTGLDPFDLNGLERIIGETLGSTAGLANHGLVGEASDEKTLATVLSAFEIPCWDLQGKALGRPLVELLGGNVREVVPYSGYLFFKPVTHTPPPDYEPDSWGEAMDADGIVAQARRLVSEYGFKSLKLKGGVLPPFDEVEVVLALRAAFPDHPLRLDPNAGWTVETSVAVGKKLDGVLEYLEDPTATIDGMAAVAREVSMPLATNMAVTAFSHLPPSIRVDAVQVILSDHHFWGGLRRSRELAAICRTFGIGLSMHSNSHLGISLAAMTHLAGATPELTYDCDTHYPYLVEDIVVPGVLDFADGAVKVPAGPGLGVELDLDSLARLAEQYKECGFDTRDDVTPMRAIQPDWDPAIPRW
ncbi:glucarate dehydratase family protein [Kribbella sp. NPDC051620]|uniref:glucarate dehydratase family protein n=1 Tax=Kribbella sp. NPDC051620 TaxID=3364120 RepID=UPI0037B6073A